MTEQQIKEKIEEIIPHTETCPWNQQEKWRSVRWCDCYAGHMQDDVLALFLSETKGLIKKCLPKYKRMNQMADPSVAFVNAGYNKAIDDFLTNLEKEGIKI